jgi:hypothetical protein
LRAGRERNLIDSLPKSVGQTKIDETVSATIFIFSGREISRQRVRTILEEREIEIQIKKESKREIRVRQFISLRKS